jgi:hypothetical protein
MRKRYEVFDKEGRFITAEHDTESGSLSVTTYLTMKKDLTAPEIFGSLGWTVANERIVTKPKVVNLKGA